MVNYQRGSFAGCWNAGGRQVAAFVPSFNEQIKAFLHQQLVFQLPHNKRMQPYF